MYIFVNYKIRILLRKIAFFILLLSFQFGWSNSWSIENVEKSIDEQYIALKNKYEKEDSLFFIDVLDVMISLKTDDKIKTNNKIVYLKYIDNFLTEANLSLFANKKMEDRNYRRAIRFFPTMVHYSENGNLFDLADYYPEEIMNALLLVPNQNVLKKMILKIGIQNPRIIYQYLDELYLFSFINEVVEQHVINHPQEFLNHYDNNPLLKTIVQNSTNPAIKTILSLKNEFGNLSTLYFYLDEIEKNGFNATKEVDFVRYKMNYTKILLKIAQDEKALGRYSTIEYVSKIGKWIFIDYIDKGEKVFLSFSSDELFMLTAMSHKFLGREELEFMLDYLQSEKVKDVSSEPIKLMPDYIMQQFLIKITELRLNKKLYSCFEQDALGLLLEKEKYQDLNKPSLKNTHWLTTKFDPEGEKRQKELVKKNQLVKTFNLNKIQFSMLKWTRNLNQVDSNINAILGSAIGGPFLNYLCSYHPNTIFNNKEKLSSRKDFDEIMTKVAIAAPNSIKKYLVPSENAVYQTLKSNSNKNVEILKQIYEKYKYNTKAYALFDLIIKNKTNIDGAHTISQNQITYLQNLCEISVSKKPVGLHSVESEQNELSLKLIREINDKPNVSNPTLSQIKQFSYKALYSFMILGREELFDFTFNQFYAALMVAAGSFDILTFFEQVNYYRFREFCNLLAEFNKFPTFFLTHANENQQNQFIEKLIQIDFSDIHALEHAANISEFIAKCENETIQSKLQQQIKKEFDKSEAIQDQLGMAVYSLLASNIGKRAHVERSWFLSMESKYAKHSVTSLKVADLIQNKKVIITSYFYNDADGIMSFNSFVNTFKNLSNWYIKDLGSYYYLSSMQGTEIDFLANKPQFEKEGQAAIAQYLTVNQMEPSIIVHRGHSYHAQKTIDQMIGSPKFIFMGSCGGYYKIPELLERSPNAQILSTKQVGTMSINDPTLKLLAEKIRTKQDIDWASFWDEQKQKYSAHKDFKDYVPPHKNNGALFINAFFKVVGL